MGRGRIRPSTWYLAAAAILAVIGLLLLHGLQASAAAAAGSRRDSMVPEVVAARPIVRGATLQAGDLAISMVPTAYVQPGSFRTVGEAVGRVALSDLSVGEAATLTRLARVRAGPVASLIPEGLRAFAVPTSLPTGSIRAGDHVDVLATYSVGEPTRRPSSPASRSSSCSGPLLPPAGMRRAGSGSTPLEPGSWPAQRSCSSSHSTRRSGSPSHARSPIWPSLSRRPKE